MRAVADPGGVLDALVAAHIVDERYEPVVEDREVAAEDLLSGWNGKPFCLAHIPLANGMRRPAARFSTVRVDPGRPPLLLAPM